MLDEIAFPKGCVYKNGRESKPIAFFMDALPHSIKFDLLLGYFSSSALNVLSLGFAHFLANGGRMRLIINDELSTKDKDAILKGSSGQLTASLFSIHDFEKIREALDDYGSHFFDCLSWLIANDRIEIVAIRPKGTGGISHFKSGFFSDGVNQIYFNGTCNFSAKALLENLEGLNVWRSWNSKDDRDYINDEKSDFERIFNGEAEDYVDYIDFEEIKGIIRSYGNKDWEQLLIQEKHLASLKKHKITEDKILKAKLNRLEVGLKELQNAPRFPYPQGPREYQCNAYNKWVDNGKKGIFAMATGTGKTITSLNCLLNEFKETGNYKAIILVPTTALVEQWKKECGKFNFKNIILVSSKEKWNDSLAFFNTASKLVNTSFIVIVTYASLSRPKFQSHFKLLPKETLLIADEAHNMGSSSIVKLLPQIHLQNRIGLSATVDRKYDDVGNNAIQRFFNDKSPYVFSYTMGEAMSSNPPALCKYTYRPHIVHLTDAEQEEYIKISKILLKYIDSTTGKYKDCVEVEELLLRRKRIIHKAENKKSVFKKIIKEEFKKRGNLRYALVYVPEGIEVDYSRLDESIENEDDAVLINEYTKLISGVDDSIMVKQFTGKTKDRDSILKDFEDGKVHALTSMKCLDEGVDVPRSELAIFCSSTGNPRQFIQRRGRVLRVHRDKVHSVIHDLVVVPKVRSNENYFDMERNLLKKELERVVDFSQLAMNKQDTYEELADVLEYYNISLYDLETNTTP